MARSPWNNWFHISGSTYGQWLRGDPKGWRARKHREHCDGDYKNPPPRGAHNEKYEQSKRLMKRERVKLSYPEREIVCRIFADTLLRYGVELVDFCIGARHYHVLARCTPLTQRPDWNRVRWVIGRGKGASARKLSKEGIRALGGIWAKRCKAKPVKDRAHQLNVAKYIPDHEKQGAVALTRLRKRDAFAQEGRQLQDRSHD